jgi:drug/metabolite transporter (DMT)-like permease
MLAFSGTLPATRLAVPGFGATVLTCGRIVMAAVLCAITLQLMRRWAIPRVRHIAGIALTGIGLAVGYPLFVALAVEHVPASHGAVVIGLAPAATAILSVIRTGERPPPRFWMASTTGVTAVALFAIWQGGGRVVPADGWLLAAALSVGVGYVEGGRVSRELGGTVTLCWAMILLFPLAAIVLIVVAIGRDWPAIPIQAWAGFAYAGVVSMFLGSVAWYEGLAAGGIARIGQLNLVQPLVALGWAALLLGEQVSWPFFMTAIVVLLCMAVCIRARESRRRLT